MKEIINIQQNEQHGLVVSSRDLAKTLGKQHKHVLDTLDNMVSNNSAETSALLIKSTYIASNDNKDNMFNCKWTT